MHAFPANTDRILRMATEAVQKGEDALLSALDQLPAAIYVTIRTASSPTTIRHASTLPAGFRRSAGIAGA
jgi:hypothetical protein